MAHTTHPVEGQIVLLAGAQASVTLEQLSTLLERVHEYLLAHRGEYERRFECIEVGDKAYYLADPDYWETVAEALGLDGTEIDAVRRAHEAQFRRDGRHRDRLEEFETALEIRHPLLVA
ncbi:MAG: hypothetical protein V5A55_03230 [Halovenus sp.]